MKPWILIVACLLGGPDGFGQEHELLVGASLGMNLSVARSPEMDGPGAQPKGGWSAAALAQYSLSPRLNLTAQLGGFVERNASHTYILPAGFDAKFVWKYSWIEATAMGSYRLFSAERFNIYGGTGFTTRRVLKASMERHFTQTSGSTSTQVDLYEEMNKWNYLIPLQAGVNFRMPGVGVMQVGTEFQWGIRDRFAPTPQAPDGDFDYGDGMPNGKFCSLSLKVSYLIPVDE